MKKLLALFALLSMAVSMNAQVTFSLDGGSNESWVIDSYTNLNTEGRIWQTNPGGNAYVIFKASEATYIQGYTIKLNQLSVDDNNNYKELGLPYAWTLSGSNDKETWTTIHRQVQANRVKEDVDNGFFKSAGKSYTYYCNSNEQFLFYKLNVTGKYGGTWGGFKMARFDLIPSDVGFSPSETSNGMDGDTNTSLTGTTLPQTIVVNGTASARMTGFQFTTGSDNATNTGRNPKDIKVEGSNDGNTWNIIEYKTEYTGLEDKNYYPYVFQCYGTQNYQKYRFSFANVTDASHNFQMSELAIITESTCTHSYSSKGFCEKCLSPKMPEQDGSNVYQISNAGELVKFGEIVNSGTAAAKGKLTADIDLTNVSWTPIGTDTNKYYGTFDGGDNSVTLAISTTESNQGLFGYAKGGADIKNLVVKGTINCGGSSAALIGQAGGSGLSGTIIISRVGCEATVTGGSSDDRIGAFVGNDWGYTTVLNIENSYNIGNISGSNGGWTSVVGCHTATGSTFTNVYNKGAISSGKFVNDNRGTCSNCYTTTSGNETTAGLTQRVTSSQVTNGELCYKLGAGWYQNLGEGGDANPILDSTHGQVILNSTYVNTVSSLSLDETNSFGTNSDFNVTSVSMTRTLKGGKWNTFCVPFAMTPEEITSQLGAGAVVKKLTGATNDGNGNYTMTFEAASAIEAGKPYMVKVAEEQYDGSISLTGTRTITGTLTNATTDAGLTFCGTYTNGSAQTGSFIISNNVFYNVDSAVTLGAFRGYITVPGAGVKALNFTFDDDATGLNDLNDFKDLKDVIYNLAGQRIGKMQKGINIVNGKKVLR